MLKRIEKKYYIHHQETIRNKNNIIKQGRFFSLTFGQKACRNDFECLGKGGEGALADDGH